MPLSPHNQHFETGQFDGFITHGLCQIQKSFGTFLSSHTFLPVRGDFFALLEDPRRIDGDGVRKLAPGDPQPVDTSHLSFTPDADGRNTLGVDGAILECQQVTINVGETLWFHWAFTRFDWSPANDFAVFAAYEGDHVDTQPIFKNVLTQTIALERQNRWYTDWQAFSWRPVTKFSGTLRWIVSNGISTSHALPRPGGSARPSALLIDCVELT